MLENIVKEQSKRGGRRIMDGLILAGGKSSRMGGSHKGDLIYQKETFLERIIHEFQKEAEMIWISYGAEIRREYPGCQAVQDQYLECGPLGGLQAGLKRCSSQLVMAAACDMPFLEMGMYQYLREQLMEAERTHPELSYAGAMPVVDGRIHPLAAIYRKQAADCFEAQIQKGNYRLRDALQCLHILYVDFSGQQAFRQMLRNINTIQEYAVIAESTEENAEAMERIEHDGKEKGNCNLRH